MVTPAPSIVVQHLLYIYDILHDERRLSVVGEVPYGDDIESAVEVGLVRAGRLRQSVLRSALEGRLIGG